MDSDSHSGDVRRELQMCEHLERKDADPVPGDTPITVRFMEPSEATQLARCVFRSYGSSYDADWVYRPDQIAERIESGLLHSMIGVDTEGEIVGHVGLTLDDPDSKVGESGQAVVDPRYRGHHLFTTLKRALADWATGSGLYGMYSEATAAHPYSQKANLDLGATETGILLGYIPASVDYKAIDKSAPEHRQSVVLFYLRTNDGPSRPIYVPTRHREMVERILRAGKLHALLEQLPADTRPVETSQFEVQVRNDHNQAVVTVQEPGSDLASAVSDLVHSLCDDKIDCIYVDLPLSRPATEVVGDAVSDIGFFFGGIFPNRQVEGDVLRLQYLNKVEVLPGDVAVASDFGRELLDYIDHDRGI